MPERIVIVGAGITGLTTALALSRAGREVIIFEQDAAPPSSTPDAVFAAWERPGVPQLRHAHGFLARLYTLLQSHYPDLLQALREAGARELRFADSLLPPQAAVYTPRPGDEDLTALLCRRTTFELVLRRYVLAQPGVRVRSGVHVTGILTTTTDNTLRLTGLTTHCADGEAEISADVVIDATGRRSPFGDWLRARGATIGEEIHAAGVIYYTRFYRLHDGSEEPQRSRYSSLADLGYLKFGVWPGDNRTFAITLAIPTCEPDLRILRQAEMFSRVCDALPALAPWVEPTRAAPTTDVFAMGGLQSRYRRFVNAGQPAARGYFATGEAAIHTNPLYGRGCTISMMHAHLLAEVLCTVPEPDQRAVRFHDLTHTEVYPFYHASVQRDREGLRRARQIQAPPARHSLRERLGRALMADGLAPAMRGDLEVRRAALRDFHMLARPGLAMRRPEIWLRIVRIWLRGKRRNADLYPPAPGPSRMAMRQLLGLATP